MANFVERLVPIFSNLIFLLPADRALKWGRGLRSFAFALVVLASGLYHLCVGFPVTCLWPFWKHHVIDFWTAEQLIPFTAIYFVRFRSPFIEKWLLLSSVVIVGLLVTGQQDTMLAQAGITVGSFIFVGVYLIWYRITHGRYPDYDLVQLTLGAACTIFSITFFVFQNYWPDGYWIMHSLWHIFGGLGQYFFMGILPPSDPMLNLDARITVPTEQPGLWNGTVGALIRAAEESMPMRIRDLAHPKWERGTGRMDGWMVGSAV